MPELVRFKCPTCGAEHTRGYFARVGSFRCLQCGYMGPSAPLSAKLESPKIYAALFTETGEVNDPNYRRAEVVFTNSADGGSHNVERLSFFTGGATSAHRIVALALYNAPQYGALIVNQRFSLTAPCQPHDGDHMTIEPGGLRCDANFSALFKSEELCTCDARFVTEPESRFHAMTCPARQSPRRSAWDRLLADDD